MTPLLAIIELFVCLRLTQAAPARNLTALHKEYAPSFVAEPNGRGTWGLLYSCIFTLALCLWTAFHPNVKSPEASETAKYKVKCLWLIVAIFAPELGVLTAFKQYRGSRVLVAELRRLRSQAQTKRLNTNAESSRNKTHNDSAASDNTLAADDVAFSHMYGFYVHMGGLAVSVNNLHDRLERVLLTPAGLIYLAEKGYFFDIADADIQDKSKASWLAKGFVLLQISWTVLQCLSRKVVGLPLSVLEVHVLVHAGCALIMYVLWFNKPMDVEEPMNVTSKIPDEVIALMLVRNHWFGTFPHRNLESPIEYRPVGQAGSKFGLWPGRNVSEAAYLMFNPYMPSFPPDLYGHMECLQERSNASRCKANNDLLPTPLLGKGAIATRLQPGQIAESHECLPQAVPVDPDSNVIHPDTELDLGTALSPLPLTITQDSAVGDGSGTSGTQKASLPPTQEVSDNQFTMSTPADATTQTEYTCHGFACKAADGVQVVSTIITGAFVENGIGPKAFLTGEWRGDIIPWKPGRRPFRRPDRIAQVPDSIRERLPLDRIDRTTIVHYFPLTISLSEKDIKRWQLAGSALRDELGPTTLSHSSDPNAAFLDFVNEADTIQGAYFSTRALLVGWQGPLIEELYPAIWGTSTFSGRYIPFLQGFYYRFRELGHLDPGLGTAVTMLPGLLYGGLHLTLWNYKFPSHVEGVLWRLSAIVLIAVPAVAAILLTAHTVYQTSRAKGLRRGEGAAPEEPALADQAPGETLSTNGLDAVAVQRRLRKLAASVKRSLVLDGWLLIALSLFMVGCLYIFSRIYIIVESFISLRHVPIGVYEEVGWSKYIPHV